MGKREWERSILYRMVHLTMYSVKQKPLAKATMSIFVAWTPRLSNPMRLSQLTPGLWNVTLSRLAAARLPNCLLAQSQSLIPKTLLIRAMADWTYLAACRPISGCWVLLNCR